MDDMDTTDRPADRHDIRGGPPPQPDTAPNFDALRRLAPLTGPGWLAATGAALLLVAAVVVVAGQWSSIGPTARFAGLVGSLVAVFAAAEAARHRVHTTATALAVLAGCLTAPVAIAAAAALDALWPTCVLAGGAASLIAVNVQSRRWNVHSLRAASVAAAVLIVAGVAALTSTPIAPLLAASAAIALGVGAVRRSIVLACLVAAVPLTSLVADAGLGPGTLVRLGAVGAQWWAILVSCVAASLVVAVSAHRRSDPVLAVTSLSLAAYGALGGALAAATPLAVWWSAPAVLVAAIQVASLVGDRSIFGRWSTLIAQASAASLALGALTAPVLIGSGRLVEDHFDHGLFTSELVPATLATTIALAIAAACARTRRHGDHDLDDLIAVGVVAAGIATLLALDVGLVLVAGAALISWVISSLATSWRSWIWTSVVHASWATFLATIADSEPWAATSIVLVAAAIVVVTAWSTPHALTHRITIAITVAIATLLIALRWPEGLSVVWTVLFVTCAVMTAVAMRGERVGPADALAVSLGAATLALSLAATPAAMSLTLVLVSAQGWLYAAARNRVDLAFITASTGGAALLSLWWTTDTNDLVISWLAPFGIDGQDLAIAAVSAGLLAAGVALRSVRSASSWLAYGPGLATLFSWLAISQVDSTGGWATGLGLILAVGCIAVGGVRRLGAPLVLGTMSLLATLVASAGPRLATAPTWTWIAAGGVVLLSTAALLERSRRPLTKTAQPLHDTGSDSRATNNVRVESVAEAFQREFA